MSPGTAHRPVAPIDSPREILIIKPSSLGDVVHTLPSAVLLRRAFPDAKVRWLVNTEWMPILAGLTEIDEVIEFPRREFRGLRGFALVGPWAAELRRRVHADLVLDYQGLLRSALIAKLCCGVDGRVLGLDDAREGARFLYREAVSTNGCVHAVDRYLALTHRVTGGSDGPIEWPLPPGIPPALAASDAASFQKPFVVLHPFSRGRGKSLTAEQVTSFCTHLAPARVVIAGRSREELPDLPNVTNLLNATELLELIWLIRHASYVVSVDSGPMHIAAAMTERLISIHTWSDPAKVGPYRPEAWVWQKGQLFQQRDRGNSAASRKAANIRDLAEFVKTQL